MSLENFTLLYVEDDKITQENLIEILEPFVHTLYVASDGEEGLKLYKEKHPDIVLTDVTMPKMNGLQMSEKIKEIDPYQAIVMVTACNELSDLHTAINLGIDKYIIKPILDIFVLVNALETIAKVLNNARKVKELEEVLQMQSKLSAVSDMIGNIAHQWRQPLTSINASANNLQLAIALGNTPDNDQLIKHTENVMLHTTYLSDTINKFRTFFQESKEIKSFSLKQSIMNVMDFFQASFLSHDIEIIHDLQDYTLVHNENQLVQALINILQNAKEAHIENKNETPSYLFIKLDVTDDKPTITIKDNAGGVPKEIIDNIFEPYFTTKHQSVGVGVSLFMSSEIITKEFNGSIQVSNEEFTYHDIPCRGAKFTIKL